MTKEDQPTSPMAPEIEVELHDLFTEIDLFALVPDVQQVA